MFFRVHKAKRSERARDESTHIALTDIRIMMRTFRLCRLMLIINSASAWLQIYKSEEPDDKAPKSTGSSNSSNTILGAKTNTGEKYAQVRIRPSSHLRLSSQRNGKTQEEMDLRLQSMSLSDRWTFILQDSDQYDTSFSRLLREEEEKDVSTESKNSKNTSTSSTGKSKRSRTLYSISWSIVLSTLTILAMTSATSFSSVLKGFPYKILEWKSLTQTLPLLLSAEQEIARKMKQYFAKKFVPLGWQTMEKMILMEIWRSIWMKSFRTMRDTYTFLFGVNYYSSLWEKCAPGWIRRGARSYFVKILQGRLQNIVYAWATRGWEVVSIGFGSGWLDFEFVEDGDADIVDESVSGDDTDTFVDDNAPELLDDVDIELEMEFEDASVDIPGDGDADIDMDDDTSFLEM